MTAAAWAETKLLRGRTLRVIAHDPFPVDADGVSQPLPPEFVMGIGGATETLLELTPRRHVGRALDLGCGSGAQTLFLDADRIIATDIDERALAAANASCHLSGFRRLEPDVWRNGDSLIEFRQGSLLEPVEGQRFDLIVANPPFVIEGVGHVHRDSPLPGDGLVRDLLAQLPEHMNEGAVAVLLASWLHPQHGDWTERIAEWLPGDVSTWVAQRDVLDIDAYIDVWSADAAVPPAERLLWRARLEALGASAVGFGWIVLHRSRAHWSVIEDVSTASRVPDGDEVLAQLASFASPPDALTLLAGAWAFVDTHWRGPLSLGPVEAALLAAVRAGATIEAAVELVAAQLPADADDLLALALAWARDAVIRGYLVPA